MKKIKVSDIGNTDITAHMVEAAMNHARDIGDNTAFSALGAVKALESRAQGKIDTGHSFKDIQRETAYELARINRDYQKSRLNDLTAHMDRVCKIEEEFKRSHTISDSERANILTASQMKARGLSDRLLQKESERIIDTIKKGNYIDSAEFDSVGAELRSRGMGEKADIFSDTLEGYNAREPYLNNPEYKESKERINLYYNQPDGEIRIPNGGGSLHLEKLVSLHKSNVQEISYDDVEY